MNTFGRHFRWTTWGESHGPAMGVVVDGCPAGIPLEIQAIQQCLDRRAPGRNPWVTPRKEPDQVQVLSGVYQGKTTGAPISMLIHNHDQDTAVYQETQGVLRPGHAQYTYWKKYGHVDERGGGRDGG